MQKTTLTARALLAAALLMITVPQAAQAASSGQRALDRQELRKMFPGTFRAQVKGYDVRFIASRDGRLKGIYGSLTDDGRWSLRGNRLCIMLKDWLKGKTRCAAVRQTSGAWYLAGDIRFRRQ